MQCGHAAGPKAYGCVRRAPLLLDLTHRAVDIAGDVNVKKLWGPWMHELGLETNKLGELHPNTAASLAWAPPKPIGNAVRLFIAVDGTGGAGDDGCAAWSFNVIAEVADGTQAFAGYMAGCVGLESSAIDWMVLTQAR